MIKVNKKICKNCNKEQFIWSKGYCKPCAFKMKTSVCKIKKKYNFKPRKATGEKVMFLEIWEDRDHICINCNVFLGTEPNVSFFAHILAKGKHPQLRLVKTNIMLLCVDCHFAYDHQTKEKYDKRRKTI